jgi:exopolysaccharide biosynthesis polyprenyl glycosylphosphotransferase
MLKYEWLIEVTINGRFPEVVDASRLTTCHATSSSHHEFAAEGPATMKQGATALQITPEDIVLSKNEFFVPVDARRMAGVAGVFKRIFDAAAAGLMVFLLLPVFLILAILVKRSSPGPVLFVQERLGRNGRPFKFYKFRSMRSDADDVVHRQFAAMFINGDQDGCHECNGGKKLFKLEKDPRVTTVGRWLRRTSLDELPQLLNVIKGDMSLVGPRPPISYEIDNYQPWHFERLKVVPGLTGLWQVAGRSKVTFDEMVHLDLHYINNWSLLLDLKILLRTIPVVLRGTGGM